MEQIFQHNWTGALAIYATSPAQPLLTQVIKGVGQHSSKSSKGVWLKAASHARLRLHESEGSGSVLEVHLQEHLLLQCPLLAEQLSLCLIPSGSTSAGSILVLNPKQQACTAAPVCYCFRFYDQSDCTSFKTALQAMVARMHSTQVQQQQEQPQEEGQQQQLLQCTAEHELQGRHEEQPALLLTGAAGSSGSGGSANGAAAAEAAAALAPTPCGQAGGAAITPADHIKDMIKRYLLDPSFHRLVDQVDALWDEVELELSDGAA